MLKTFIKISLILISTSFIRASERGVELISLEKDNIKSQAKELIIKYPKILEKYPELAKKAFGTDDINELKKQGFIPNAFKQLLTESKEVSTIIIGSILAAITYGIINDQITARICLEYFSKGFHKDMMMSWRDPIFKKLRNILMNSSSPTTYAFIWGTIATWWVGAIGGIPLAIIARLGSPWVPGVDSKELVKPLKIALPSIAAGTFLTGLYTYLKYKNNTSLINNYRNMYYMAMSGVSESNLLGFIVDSNIHFAAYAGGGLAGLALIGYTAYKRFNKSKELEQQAQKLLDIELKHPFDNK